MLQLVLRMLLLVAIFMKLFNVLTNAHKIWYNKR